MGGGLTGAASLFLQAIVDEMNSQLENMDGEPIPRIDMKTYNLEDNKGLEEFLSGENREVRVPGTDRTVTYDPVKRTGIGISRLGTSKAVGIGAYAFALSKLDKC